jgi:hypothetical protein
MMADRDATIGSRLAKLFARPGFWQERWRAAGHAMAPASLREVPVVAPDELARDEHEHPPFGSWRSGDAFVRVGWTLVPRVLEALFFSAGDLAREAAVGARSLAAAGLERGWRETNTLAGGLATPGSLLVGDAVQALGSLDMPVGPLDKPPARATALDFWSRVRPDFAVLDTAGATDLAALLADEKRSARELGLRAAALITDLRDPAPVVLDLGLPLTRIVGLAEAFSLLAAQTPDGAFFPPADEVYCEVLDGQLVLTTLHHTAALVRYAPGVRVRPAGVSPGRGSGAAEGFLVD